MNPEDEFLTWSARFEREHPEEVAAARARAKRSITKMCHFGNCTVDIDPEDGKIWGGMGPMLCPCEILPYGWHRSRHEGTARPHPPVKAVGRHGSRVTRSRRRHTLPDWIRNV